MMASTLSCFSTIPPKDVSSADSAPPLMKPVSSIGKSPLGMM